jgi:hypothetical protein
LIESQCQRRRSGGSETCAATFGNKLRSLQGAAVEFDGVNSCKSPSRFVAEVMLTVLSVAQVEALRAALSEPGVLFLEQTKLLRVARSIVPDILNETVFR